MIYLNLAPLFLLLSCYSADHYIDMDLDHKKIPKFGHLFHTKLYLKDHSDLMEHVLVWY